MRLKTFTAPDTTRAMEQVKELLGGDAIIVSTQELPGGGVRLTAALDTADLPPAGGDAAADGIADIDRALRRHGLPERMQLRLMNAARRGDGPADMRLAGALDQLFTFAPLPERRTEKPLLFVGPPGAGKTLAVAKLAARAVMAGQQPVVLTTDVVRAGGVDQLAAFTQILELTLTPCADAQAVAGAVARAGPAPLIFIDTAATNPFDPAALERCEAVVAAAAGEAVAVLPAGLDAEETADMAAAFADIGAKRLLMTRLDAARRFGGLLYGLDSGNLCLCDASMTPQVSDGLSPMSPLSLARLLLSQAACHSSPTRASEVVPS